jgi:hypothetical protein
MAYDPFEDKKFGGFDPFAEEEDGGFDPFEEQSGGFDPFESSSRGFDPFGDDSEDEDYNPFRAGVVNFVESAVGLGTEADALYRRLSGDAETFEEAHAQSVAMIDDFEADYEYANYLSTGAGFAAGLLVPSAAFAKVGQVASGASKAKAIAKGAGIGAAEGAAYGFFAGDTMEERTEGVVLGGVLGGALTGAVGKFVIKTDDEIAAAAAKAAKRTGRGSFLGGADGFADVKKAETTQSMGTMQDTTTQDIRVKNIVDDEELEKLLPDDVEDAWGIIPRVGRSTKAWIEKHVGVRVARMAEDAENMSRRGRHAIDKDINESPEMTQAFNTIRGDDRIKGMLLRLNPERKNSMKWHEVLNAEDLTDTQRTALASIKTYVNKLQASDPLGFKVNKDGKIVGEITDYVPARFIDDVVGEGGTASASQYDDIVEGIREYAYELNDYQEIAKRFLVDGDTGEILPKYRDQIIKLVNNKRNGKHTHSRLQATIQAIATRAKDEGAADAVVTNLINGLNTQFIHSRQGGNALGSIVRRATSTGLLANPMNAVLNMIEGFTAPVYQNGFMAWAETLPEAIVSTFNKKAGIRSASWLDDSTMGHGGQYMGELAQTAQEGFVKQMDEFRAFNGLDKTGRVVDKAGEVLYKISGVDTVNRMTREILSNSAVKRGVKLARKAFTNDKDMAKLLKHDGMRGLSQSEQQATIRALKKFGSDPKSMTPTDQMWLNNFAGAALNKWQPVSASSLPKAFHDNPNGRVMYSMLSYMNRQMNNIIDDIGRNYAGAIEAGLNTKKGQELMKEAYMNGAKYSALFGVVAGAWNTARGTMDPNNDRKLEDVFTPDGMSEAAINELASNLTMGLYNSRAQQYGKKPGSIESMIPAPLTAAGKFASGLDSLVREGDATDLGRAVETYVPGVSNLDRAYRLGTGNRLLTQENKGQGYLTEGNTTDFTTGMLYDLINQK